jgi:hypothetical protein
MILVAGLALAGLVGIAAAFYFSIRTSGSSKKRKSRGRAAGSGRARADRHLGSASAARDERPANGRWAAQREAATVATPAFGPGGTPEVSLDDTPGDAWPGPGPDDSPRPLGGFGPATPRPGSRTATRMARAGGPAAGEDTDKTAKPRRRMGFRKGADMDEEMWPTESFGGVTDDQFWDDLASDKPLARTARTAQQPSAKRPLAADPPTQQRPGLKDPKGPKPGGAWGNTRRTGNSAYPEPSPSAADRTAIQPVLTQQASTQPTPMAPGQGAPGQGARGQGASGQGGSGQGNQYARPGSQPMRTGAAPGETSGRRLGSGTRASEDPLTSAAFALRSSGPVDGRSNQVPSGPHDTSRAYYPDAGNRAAEDRARPDRSQPSGGWYRSSDTAAVEDFGSPADARRGTAAYPYTGQPLGAPVVEAAGTPPYGLPYETPYGVPYGYGNGSNTPAPADRPRRPNPAGSPNRAGEPIRRGGSGYQAPRQGQGEGHPSGGQRRVRDPRDDYQRLVSRV